MIIRRLKIRNFRTGIRSLNMKVVVESGSTKARKRTLIHAPDWIKCSKTLPIVTMTHMVNALKLDLGGLVNGAINDGRLREG